MTNAELKTWEEDCRKLTTEELRLLAKLLELKRERLNKKPVINQGD